MSKAGNAACRVMTLFVCASLEDWREVGVRQAAYRPDGHLP